MERKEKNARERGERGRQRGRQRERAGKICSGDMFVARQMAL